MQGQLDFNPASDTSRDAAIFSMPNRERDRDKALRALTDAGERGLTDFELETITGVRQQSIGKRRLDLMRDGFVARRLVIDPATFELIPDRRPAPSGAMAAVWCLQRYSQPEDVA